MRRLLFATIVLIIFILLGQRVEFRGENNPVTSQNGVSTDTATSRKVLERLSDKVRQVTPPEVLPAPELSGVLVERLPAKELPPKPPRPPKPDQWLRPKVVSAGIFKSNGKTIKLTGIAPLQLEKKCEDKLGNFWPCGMFARTALRQFVRGRPIECAPTEGAEVAIIETRCSLAGFDISAWLVWQGWGVPEDGLFETELDQAQNNGHGIWREQAPGY